MGGTDDPSNLIELSVEEHAEAHKFLYEKYNKNEDYIAWKALSGQLSNLELMREKSVLGGKSTKGKKRNKEFCENARNRRLGKKLSEETKEKIRLSRLGQPARFKSHTKESKEKLANYGKTLLGEKNPFYGKKHSDETKKKISESKKLKSSKSLNI